MTRAARAKFDWVAFRKAFFFQPVPVWIASVLLLRPAALVTPVLLRAACVEPARTGVRHVALFVYILVLPAAAPALVYLLAGRRRMTKQLRLMGDVCLVLVLLISAGYSSVLVRSARANWPTLRPGLSALRAACWK